ncbi:hypothetical protein LCGC14_1739420 [marine sediment metagenome]|uniref:Uncharacterized protein n=1 Tax=marine sediment metagenome TaxID=412755 RepID=A0A0F9K6V5_9ZZZZ
MPRQGRLDRDRRRADAEQRQEERTQRGDAGQLLLLEERGFGDCKEAQGLRIKLSGGPPGPFEGILEVEE